MRKRLINANKVEPKCEIMKDIWYICTCTTCSEDSRIWFRKGTVYLGKEILKYDLGFEPDDYQNYFRIWTIQDAKDGDVLCCESSWTCIFKALYSDNNCFSSYCFMDSDGWFCERGSKSHILEDACIKAYHRNIYPATKEQRDTFFAKMREEGWEWDIEKKELRRVQL